MKIRLSRERLNSQGYDRCGCYWGVGLPLWCVDCDDDVSVFRHIRARDRDAAKEAVRKLFPGAKFYR